MLCLIPFLQLALESLTSDPSAQLLPDSQVTLSCPLSIVMDTITLFVGFKLVP